MPGELGGAEACLITERQVGMPGSVGEDGNQILACEGLGLESGDLAT